jgi:hypothetical protein
MAVILFMRVPELTPQRYGDVVADLELDANPPAGMILHVASEAVGAVNVMEVWQTAEAAESYVKEALSYRLEPMRNLFSPEMDVIERLGSTALPGAFGSRARAS